MAPLLNLIIVTGGMFVAAGFIEREPRYVVAGAALILLGLVEWLAVWLRHRHRTRRARASLAAGAIGKNDASGRGGDMERWEYCTVLVDHASLTLLLNRYGTEGWELVNLVPRGLSDHDGYRAVFKRRLAGPVA
jgi:hypothetical protein